MSTAESLRPVAVAPVGRLQTWVAGAVTAPEFFTFRRLFAAVWLVYDVLDVSLRGTVGARDWFSDFNGYPKALLVLQLVCIAAEVILVVGRAGGALTVASVGLFLARWRISDKFFGLNDFRHITVLALLLAFLPATKGPQAPRWLIDVFRWETAWVYLATGFLKVNSAFLSGGHLYVRHNYLRLRGWPYPGVVSGLLERHWVNRGLAIFTVVAELSIGLLLLAPGLRARRLALPIAIAIHGGAALLIDVWFFGVSMILLVWCVSRQPVSRQPIGRQPLVSAQTVVEGALERAD